MNSFRVLLVPLLVVPVLTDYDCVCNYNVEENVLGTPGVSQPIGYLYEFDCKPQAGPDSGDYYQVMYEKQIAYIHKNAQVQLQTCPGDIPDEDKLTTKAGQITTTSTPSTTPVPTTVQPNTVTTTIPTTSTTATPKSTTTPILMTDTTPSPSTSPRESTTTTLANTTPSSGIPEGHIEICPKYVKDIDVNRFNGFLGQYGEFCYELVNQATQYSNAERHCAIVSTGHLVQVLNQDEQDYLVRFLNKHNYVQSVWLGLTDSGNANEGTWRWSSGAPYKFNNFKGDYTQHTSTDHKLNDCVILKQGGEWTDVACGVTFFLGTGFGEKHPYICQY
ncbi:uncharacterized protein LOC132758876, partial [Ruditapes philippinarum]|uniref:uncharacterized protein LOC132758876 n=1 Tax=Ruditapes philippinarum TaxID=129788 RepID=UPI00295BD725